RTATRRPTTTTRTADEGTEGPVEGSTPNIGGSLNGRAYRLEDDFGLIERCGTDWLHAFLDVREKYERGVSPEEDPDVVALRRAGQEMGTNLFVTLQWNFIGIFGEKQPTGVPPEGSARERDLIEYATALLSAIDQPVAVVGLGNEPVWETMDDDFLGSDTRLIPFTRTLKDHLVEHYVDDDTRIVIGAFNRFYDTVWDDYKHFFRRLIDVARTDEDVDGIDLHIHYYHLQQAETMLEVARREFPDGMVTVTEFSPIFRYADNQDKPIASFEGGERFAKRHEIAGDTTVTEYLEGAKDDRLSPQEIADFYATMPWYNVDFVSDMYDLLDRYDVEVGTFGFLVDDDVHNVDWTDGWSPFPINCLFQPALIDTPHGAHPHYLPDFLDVV
ncbi:MAG TPA: hypothetical protein VKA37_07755, partial [Halobacteriales archaeon]|nr:hypothetical protein [Halobacteriales archaeon]